MTKRRRHTDRGNYRDRTGLEFALIGIIFVSTIFASAIIIFLTIDIPDLSPSLCTTHECTIQAAKISQYINFSVEPCDDFYQFACGNFLKNAFGDVRRDSFISVQETTNRQFIDLFNKPIEKNEHFSIKAAKTLFNACMDEEAIETNGLKDVQKLLKIIGGWPVVDNFDWDHTKFDWLEATYQLSKLGYPHDVFLDLLVTPDPVEHHKNLFEIAIPLENNKHVTLEEDKRMLMIKLAIALGADNLRAEWDAQEVIQFEKKLLQHSFSNTPIQKLQRKFILADFKLNSPYNIDWLQFINTIAAPVVQISKNTSVVFPQLDTLDRWLYFLSKTPKRVQANYMVWKVLQNITLYLPNSMRMLIETEHKETANRQTFCLRENLKRIFPNPVCLIYMRKYSTTSKITKAEKLVYDVKVSMYNTIQHIKWINDKDKKIILENIETMNIVLGIPKNYSDDKIFNELIVDWKDVTSNASFLNLVISANRNAKSILYLTTEESNPNNNFLKWISGTEMDYNLYDLDDNTLIIPPSILQGMLFDENRPSYLNYAALGTLVAQEIAKLLTSTTKYGYDVKQFNIKIKCLAKDLYDFNPEYGGFLPELIFLEALAINASYEAYKNIILTKGEDLMITTKYTNKHLFWIFGALTVCKPRNFYDQIFKNNEDYSSALVNGALKNSAEFANDFNCLSGSYMNPFIKCELF